MRKGGWRRTCNWFGSKAILWGSHMAIWQRTLSGKWLQRTGSVGGKHTHTWLKFRGREICSPGKRHCRSAAAKDKWLQVTRLQRRKLVTYSRAAARKALPTHQINHKGQCQCAERQSHSDLADTAAKSWTTRAVKPDRRTDYWVIGLHFKAEARSGFQEWSPNHCGTVLLQQAGRRHLKQQLSLCAVEPVALVLNAKGKLE